MRLVASSNPGDVERDEAIYLLTERALLTRMVCQELLGAQGDFFTRRPRAALGMLLVWIQENFPDSVVIESHARDGIDEMTVPEECQALLQEIRAGANVCEALFMLTTADTSSEVEHDEQQLREALDKYRESHGEVVNSPRV
jgi:hypothetical protein